VSGKQNLIFQGNVDVSAANGILGTLLLDPPDIVVAPWCGWGLEPMTGNWQMAAFCLRIALVPPLPFLRVRCKVS
jgi:hypothetical protein